MSPFPGGIAKRPIYVYTYIHLLCTCGFSGGIAKRPHETTSSPSTEKSSARIGSFCGRTSVHVPKR